VTSAGRHDHCKFRTNVIFHTVDVDRTLPSLEPKELIAIGVNLLADLLAGLKRHED
jgi:hypothetical protein